MRVQDDEFGSSSETGADDLAKLAVLGAHLVTARRSRAQFFSPELFGEPAWDMMLDLFIAQCKGKRISISSACIASGAAPTTALRWLTRMEKAGLIERIMDTHDRRRVFVRLSPTCFSTMKDWMSEIAG